MARVRIYIHSHAVPTVGVVDKEGAMHACAQAQTTAFQGLGKVSSLLGNRYLTDEEREFLTRVEDFCINHRLEYETIDLGSKSFLARMALRLKGVRTPAIFCEGQRLYGIPRDEDLRALLAS